MTDAVFIVHHPEGRVYSPGEVLAMIQQGLQEAQVLGEEQIVELHLAQAVLVDDEWGERVEHAAKVGGMKLERVR